MPYKVIGDEVSLLRQLSEYRDPDTGKVLGVDNDSVIWLKDDTVPDDQLSPIVVAAYDRNESHIRSLIVRIEEDGTEVDVAPPPAPPAEPEQLPIVSKVGTGAVVNTPLPSPSPPAAPPAEEETTEEDETPSE